MRRVQPLYRQIAARIGYSIATGRFRNGDRLPALREAHRTWRVNLHTLRRAYQELERTGLIRIHPRTGAVVLPSALATRGSPRGMLAAMLEQAEHRYGLSASAVTTELQAMLTGTPSVIVAECSRTLAASIGAQLSARWRVHPVPRLLGPEPLPGGDTVSTYFHLQDLLRSRVDVLDVAFVHIRPATPFLEQIERMLRQKTVTSLVLCETDHSLANDLVAELRTTLGRSAPIAIQVTDEPGRLVQSAARSTLHLVSPRNWDRLSVAARRRPNLLAVEYAVESSDLEQLGGYFGWRRNGEGSAHVGEIESKSPEAAEEGVKPNRRNASRLRVSPSQERTGH